MNFWNMIIGTTLHEKHGKKEGAHLVLLDGSGFVDGEHVEGGDIGRQES